MPVRPLFGWAHVGYALVVWKPVVQHSRFIFVSVGNFLRIIFDQIAMQHESCMPRYTFCVIYLYRF